MSLGERIFDLRSKKGLSQESLSEKLEVSRQSISKWETDQSVPEIDKIIKLSEVFEVTTDYLLKDVENISTVQNVVAIPTPVTVEITESKKTQSARRFISKLLLILAVVMFVIGFVFPLCFIVSLITFIVGLELWLIKNTSTSVICTIITILIVPVVYLICYYLLASSNVDVIQASEESAKVYENIILEES